MKIPHEDRRADMKRRWTDIRKINKFRFHENMADNNTNIGNDSLGIKNYLIARFNKHWI